MDLSQYLDIFIEESKEHLQALNEQVLILEKEPDNADTINEIFRAAHSLKGMSELWVIKNTRVNPSYGKCIFGNSYWKHGSNRGIS